MLKSEMFWTALLLAVAAQAQSSGRGLRVGAARIDITPEEPVALAGYSNPETRMSVGIHDRLYARAIAFQNGSHRLVLVSCDLTGFQYVPVLYFQKEIFEKFNLQPDELLLCGTHTHSGPMVFLNAEYPHPNNFRYSEALRGKLVEVVGKALSSAGPARIGAGLGHSPIAVNRRLPLPPSEIKPGGDRVTMGRNPDGPVDREVQVLRIAKNDGSPIACLFDYGCHSRSLKAGNKLVSGDIFGIAEQFVEKILGPNVVSPAFAGASGDVDPWYVLPGFREEPGWIPETVLMGNLLGEEVVTVFRNVTDLAGGQEIRTVSDRLVVPSKAPGTPSKTEVPPKSVQMVAAAIGTEIAFVGVDCEALVEIGKEIKAKSPFRHTFIVTNCNGGSGYLPPAHLYPERGYEVDISGFGPDAADMVVNGALRLLSALRTGR